MKMGILNCCINSHRHFAAAALPILQKVAADAIQMLSTAISLVKSIFGCLCHTKFALATPYGAKVLVAKGIGSRCYLKLGRFCDGMGRVADILRFQIILVGREFRLIFGALSKECMMRLGSCRGYSTSMKCGPALFYLEIILDFFF